MVMTNVANLLIYIPLQASHKYNQPVKNLLNLLISHFHEQVYLYSTQYMTYVIHIVVNREQYEQNTVKMFETI